MGVSGAGALVALSLTVLVAMANVGAIHGLTTAYYDQSCPSVYSIVKAEVQKAVKAEKRMAASLVRLHFHDCFVNGCDGSLLLDSTATFVSEKFAFGNINSVRGFEVIDSIKKALEKACPRTVSCADILAIAYRDSVVAVGFVPEYPVSLGRRDSLTADRDLANIRLPNPAFNLTQLKEKFSDVGLDETDLIALSGAHTIGRVSCGNIRFSGVINDVGSNADFRKHLEELCPATGPANSMQDFDYRSPDKFDNNYYKNLQRGEGAIRSDQTLQSTRGPNQDMVKDFAKNQENFFAQFARSSIKMGNIRPPPQAESQVRRDCRVVNPPSLIEYE
jgi:peroxidase